MPSPRPRRRRPAARLAQPRRRRRLPRLGKELRRRPSRKHPPRRPARPSPWPSPSQPSLKWPRDRPSREQRRHRSNLKRGLRRAHPATFKQPLMRRRCSRLYARRSRSGEMSSGPRRRARPRPSSAPSPACSAAPRTPFRRRRRKPRSPPFPDARDVPAPERGDAPVDVDPGAAPTFDIVRIEPRGRAVMAGRAAPGAQVEIRSGDRLIDRARADQRGEWVVVPAEPLTRGVQELRLSARLDDRPAVEFRRGARGRNT